MDSFKTDRGSGVKNSLFCRACLVNKPTGELSPDPRYCTSCFNFLLIEAEVLAGNRRPGWIPKQQPDKTSYRKSVDIINETPKDRVAIMSNAIKSQKRGPKHRALPEDLILQMAKQGLTSQAISDKLKEQDIEVSYRTILRILAGQRVLRELVNEE